MNDIERELVTCASGFIDPTRHPRVIRVSIGEDGKSVVFEKIFLKVVVAQCSPATLERKSPTEAVEDEVTTGPLVGYLSQSAGEEVVWRGHRFKNRYDARRCSKT
ncbi:hypothetical protein QP028_02940 [Corynebacterium suedekumii]|nr:hypothetical protein QP028_02940 [Corynebacterium suedekumii]